MVKSLISSILQSPIRYLALAFVLTQVWVWHDGGVNTASRFAALRAMTESGTFNIDRYSDWTFDWSQSPNGSKYSNKAPGPMFLAFPLMFVMDRMIFPFQKNSRTSVDGFLRNPPPRRAYKTLISFIFQVIPFTVLVILLAGVLAENGVGLLGQSFAACAAFFGNTLVFFMNSYFGHGVAAVCLLGLLLALIRQNYFWVGMCFGWAVCSDYSCAAILPALIATLALDARQKKLIPTLLQIGVGGILPGILWVWYHTVCFGSPWATGPQYYNPIFIETQTASSNSLISGVLDFLPRSDALIQLLIGLRRGILYTQPWVLMVLLGSVVVLRANSQIILKILVFSLLSFFGVLYLNASFSGWHGGGSPGPRYLSIIFPLIALLGGVIFEKIRLWAKILWVGGLGVAVCLWFVAFPFEPTSPAPVVVWSFYTSVEDWRNSVLPWLKLSSIVVTLGWGLFKTWQLYQQKHSNNV